MMEHILANQSQMYQWVIIPVLVFFARMCDVALDTVRIMLLSKGKKRLAPLLGFVQVLIWLMAIRQVILNISNVACYIAFAGGFAMGTYVGMLIEERLAIGMVVVRVITRRDVSALVGHLREKRYGVTHLDGQGATGKVSVVYTVVSRADARDVIEAIKVFHPRAFYTIEDLRAVSEGAFSYKGKKSGPAINGFMDEDDLGEA